MSIEQGLAVLFGTIAPHCADARWKEWAMARAKGEDSSPGRAFAAMTSVTEGRVEDEDDAWVTAAELTARAAWIASAHPDMPVWAEDALELAELATLKAAAK